MATYTGYCMRCKAKVEFDGEVFILILKNGARMAKGTHTAPDGTEHKVNALLPKDA